ncbi:MAG TPA: hypothetical protein PKB00_13180, partial [Microthrixaceae bacterium]|nr:hypothetical protein [Microthrixaceae bacterium]
MTLWNDPQIESWQARGRRVTVSGPALPTQDVFVVDVAAADPDPALEVLLVVHGFPTSSFDWAHLVDDMARARRVVLVEGREVEVEASWVGVASSREPRPTIFLVTARQFDARVVQVVDP